MVGSVSRLTAAVHSLSLRAIRGGGSSGQENVGIGNKLGLVESSWLGQLMGWNDSDSALCMANCSGHGECMNGTCFCEVSTFGSCYKCVCERVIQSNLFRSNLTALAVRI